MKRQRETAIGARRGAEMAEKSTRVSFDEGMATNAIVPQQHGILLDRITAMGTVQQAAPISGCGQCTASVASLPVLHGGRVGVAVC